MSLNGYHRLFPTIIGDILREDLTNPVQKIINSYSENDWNENVSHSTNVLQKQSKLKKEFTNSVKNFLKTSLFINQDIKITTSWFTKNTTDAFFDHRHKHTNSWYSAVFYLQDNSHIKFEIENPQIYVMPKKWTIDNGSTQILIGKKGTLFVFPSFTMHSPVRDDTNTIRYSLAMNFMPVGTVGFKDSTYTYA